MNMTKRVKWDILATSLGGLLVGAHFDQYPKRIFVGSTQVEDGTRMLGLTIRGQNGLAVATQVQRVHVRVWT